jgi:hypothetical protein
MKHRSVAAIASAAILLAVVPAARGSGPHAVTSGFNRSTEGWGFQTSGPPAAGPNWDAKAHWVTAMGSAGYPATTYTWVAPQKFLGDKNNFYGGHLRFQLDLFRDTVSDLDVQITLTSASGTIYSPTQLIASTKPGFLPLWQPFDFGLTEAGWGNISGPATEASFKATLAGLTGLGIAVIDANNTTSFMLNLDTVSMKP